jgi:pyruvate kinase
MIVVWIVLGCLAVAAMGNGFLWHCNRRRWKAQLRAATAVMASADQNALQTRTLAEDIRKAALAMKDAAEKELAEARAKAAMLIERAQKMGEVAANGDHKVCSECRRIVAVHSTDENGKTTCSNCLKDLVNA